MASSKLLKERIESIQDTRKITNAMYLISSSKLRKARRNYQNVLPYFTRMRDTISRVVPHLPEEPVHPYFHERQREDGNPRRAYLVLTADKGMAGSFNQNVLKLLGKGRCERPFLCHRSGGLPRPPQGPPAGEGVPVRRDGTVFAACP